MFSVKDKVVLVTGGSKGIGKGIAQVFCKAGAKVMICARNEEAAKATATELDCQYVLGDVGNWEDMQRMVSETIQAFATSEDGGGRLDILCANAGYFPQAKILDMEPSEWDGVMQTNLKSSFLGVKAVLPIFEKQQTGRIILTSSITGPITGYPGWSHYSASKAGQLGFMRTAAIELSKYNVTINAILPGNIYTEGLADLGEEYLEAMAKSIPM